MKIFLTGGNGCIGKEIKKALLWLGAEVISPSSKELDLSSDFKLKTQKVDSFIHCAGINTLAPYDKIKTEEFNRLLNINTISFIKLCGQLDIQAGGSILAIGSLYSACTKEQRLQYTVSKHALYGAVKTLALEMSAKEIKVNMISPGFVDTDLTRKNNSKKRINFLKQNVPLGLTPAREIAKVCSYFIDKNQHITGQNIVVDGGYSLRGI